MLTLVIVFICGFLCQQFIGFIMGLISTKYRKIKIKKLREEISQLFTDPVSRNAEALNRIESLTEREKGILLSSMINDALYNLTNDEKCNLIIPKRNKDSQQHEKQFPPPTQEDLNVAQKRREKLLEEKEKELGTKLEVKEVNKE